MTYNPDDFAPEVAQTKSNGDYKPVPKGTYDALVHGIAILGLREPHPQSENQTPMNRVRFIFELHSDPKSPSLKDHMFENKAPVLKLDVSLSNGGHYLKLIKALLGDEITKETIQPYTKPSGQQQLLGKGARVTVVNYKDKRNKDQSKILSEISELGVTQLDSRVPPPDATRDTFFFNPYDVHTVNVFEENLTYWTQKDIMSAVNSNQFPNELKAAWEASKIKNADKEKDNTADNAGHSNTTQQTEYYSGEEPPFDTESFG